MRTHARARHLLGAVLATAVVALATASTAQADQGVARDTTEACEVVGRSPFVDRPADGSGSAIDCVAFYRITTGTTDRTFGAGLPVARGQMASFVVRTGEVAGLSLPAPQGDVFADVAGSVHELAVNRVASAGIVTGFPDGSFRPAAVVTRAQVATFVAGILSRAGGTDLPAATADYFSDDAGNPHEAAVNRLAEIGVVTGRADRTFGPGQAVTRGQMALLLARGLDWLSEARGTPLARTGLPTTIAGPELVSATATTAAATTVAALAFDEEVAPTAVVAGGVHVIAFDGSAMPATSVVRDTVDRRVVRASFPAESARLATTVTVAMGAVQGVTGNAGPEGAVPLQPIQLLPGTTAAPDLFSVTRLGATVVDFNFDEPAFVVRPSGYRLLLADGTVRRSTAALGDGTTTHTVTFPDLSGDDAARVVRAVVDTGTVSDAREATATSPTSSDPPDGALNPQQAVAVAAGGAMAAIPDLVSVTVDPESDQLRYTFDDAVAVDSAAAARFRTYGLGASEVVGTTAVRAADDTRSVVVTFADGTITGLTAGGSVDDGAVRSNGGAQANRADEVGLPRSFGPGETAAPDLVRAGRLQRPAGTDGSTSAVRRIVFQFDQPLTLVASNAFSVYAPSGERTPLTGCVRADPLAVACTVDAAADPTLYAAVGAAARAGVARGAVTDLSGSFAGHADSALL